MDGHCLVLHLGRLDSTPMNMGQVIISRGNSTADITRAGGCPSQGTWVCCVLAGWYCRYGHLCCIDPGPAI